MFYIILSNESLQFERLIFIHDIVKPEANRKHIISEYIRAANYEINFFSIFIASAFSQSVSLIFVFYSAFHGFWYVVPKLCAYVWTYLLLNANVTLFCCRSRKSKRWCCLKNSWKISALCTVYAHICGERSHWYHVNLNCTSNHEFDDQRVRSN